MEGGRGARSSARSPPVRRPPCLPSFPRPLTCRRLAPPPAATGLSSSAPRVAALPAWSFSPGPPPPQEPPDPPPLLSGDDAATMLLSPPQTPTGGSRARPERRRWPGRRAGAQRARSRCCGLGAPAGGGSRRAATGRARRPAASAASARAPACVRACVRACLPACLGPAAGRQGVCVRERGPARGTPLGRQRGEG